MPPFGLGAHESPKDIRTINSSVLVSAPQSKPVSFDILYQRDTKMQYNIGICTAESVAGYVEQLVGDGVRLSADFIYKVGKYNIDGNTTEGSCIMTMLKAAQKYGIAPESMVPKVDANTVYSTWITDFNFAPEVYQAALKYKIGTYAQVNIDEESLTDAILHSPAGIMTRMAIGNEFWTKADGTGSWAFADISPLRPPQTVISGHAQIAKGYKDYHINLSLRDRNSWSNVWGDNGEAFFNLKDWTGNFTEAWIATLPQLQLNKNLYVGISSPDVAILQSLLRIDGEFTYPQTTNFFGPMTLNAVIKFQNKYGITPTGFVGPITRAKLNTLLNK